MVDFRTIYDWGLIEEGSFICWDRVYTYTGNAHTTEYIFPSSLTYQSIHQYLIETINLSLLEPHFIYRLRWKAIRVWGRKQHLKWKDLVKINIFLNQQCWNFLTAILYNEDTLFIFPPFMYQVSSEFSSPFCTLSIFWYNQKIWKLPGMTF